eukprot:XP_014054956.1 PREDICTED: nitric oxide-associated protein 1-like isoform X2 [Salmo salar]
MLNLLKFPIINPIRYCLFRRSKRLQSASKQTESDLSPQELKRLEQFSKQGYLVGCIGRTFWTVVESKRGLIQFDPDSLAYGEDMIDKEERDRTLFNPSPDVGLTLNKEKMPKKDAHWLYDTPGIMKEHDVSYCLLPLGATAGCYAGLKRLQRGQYNCCFIDYSVAHNGTLYLPN